MKDEVEEVFVTEEAVVAVEVEVEREVAVEVEAASGEREGAAGRPGGVTGPGAGEGLRPRAASIASSTSSGRWQGWAAKTLHRAASGPGIRLIS